MKIRVWNQMSYMDIELEEKIDKEQLVKSIDEGSTIYLRTKDNTDLFINTPSIVAIEILDIPPISKEE